MEKLKGWKQNFDKRKEKEKRIRRVKTSEKDKAKKKRKESFQRLPFDKRKMKWREEDFNNSVINFDSVIHFGKKNFYLLFYTFSLLIYFLRF